MAMGMQPHVIFQNVHDLTWRELRSLLPESLVAEPTPQMAQAEFRFKPLRRLGALHRVKPLVHRRQAQSAQVRLHVGASGLAARQVDEAADEMHGWRVEGMPAACINRGRDGAA